MEIISIQENIFIKEHIFVKVQGHVFIQGNSWNFVAEIDEIFIQKLSQATL